MKSAIHLAIAAVIIALGMLGSSALISRFLVRIQHEKEISVKGFAETSIRSDRGTLAFTVNARNLRRDDAYESVTRQVDEVLERVRKGAPADLRVDRRNAQVSERKKLDDKGKRTDEIESYGASQTVTLSSGDVAWIEGQARSLNALLGEGYDIGVGAPSFIVTDLTEIKQELLRLATADGLRRADLLARNGGATVGPLRSARQGVFQITEPDSTRTSSYGVYDTSTIDKSIKAVVTLEYSIR